jgi:hypothetical protein
MCEQRKSIALIVNSPFWFWQAPWKSARTSGISVPDVQREIKSFFHVD